MTFALSQFGVRFVVLNLVLPFAVMTYLWIVPIRPLPFELLRLYKNR